MNANPIIQINMLGGFCIRVGNSAINDQIGHSKKPWNLLEYLITFRQKEISQNELIELLWPDEESNNPISALKTLLHRSRKLLKELDGIISDDLIVQRRGSYGWNTNYECTVDVDVFEMMYHSANLAQNDMERLKFYKKAIELYKGDFLPKTNLEAWVVPINTYYHSLYLKIVHETINLLNNLEKYEDITNICRKALAIDAYDEEIHYQLIYSLYKQGQNKIALKQYFLTNDLLIKKFNIVPSKKLKDLYKTLQNIRKETNDLSVIKQQLIEDNHLKGAYYCDYELFKNIYQLTIRTIQRSQIKVHLCLLTAIIEKNKGFTMNELNHIMEQLKNSIYKSLRCSDIFARYNTTQYIIMLPNTTYHSSEMIMHRIMKHYRTSDTKYQASFHSNIQSLDSFH